MSVNQQLLTALKAAGEHLDYCGYGGTSWERECADASGLSDKIEAAIAAGDVANAAENIMPKHSDDCALMQFVQTERHGDRVVLAERRPLSTGCTCGADESYDVRTFEPPEVRYINVYAYQQGRYFITSSSLSDRASADRAAAHRKRGKRVACRRLEFTEGQFDE